jgi:hypothetical protein
MIDKKQKTLPLMNRGGKKNKNHQHEDTKGYRIVAVAVAELDKKNNTEVTKNPDNFVIGTMLRTE